MAKVGIYCPEWVLAKHNTDHKIIKDFVRLQEYTDVTVSLAASDAYTWSFNLRRLANQVAGIKSSFIVHGLNKEGKNTDLIYHYDQPIYAPSFFKNVGSLPVIITTGFMTDQYMIDKLGRLPDRQKEADQLASKLESATVLHFHTENGRQRFLRYCPDFAEKTTTIPFFLPNLAAFETAEKEKVKGDTINILFVGNEGNRKGLQELIEAFDLLGADYLNIKKVCLTVVSKDKPQPKTDFRLEWHTKLPHELVIELMHKASIFTLIPRRESYGLVLIEAMLSGCAIITDNDETRKEILDTSGLLLSSKTPVTIASALRQLIEDNLYREALGEKAYQRAKSLFIPSVVAQQYSDCFESIISVKAYVNQNNL